MDLDGIVARREEREERRVRNEETSADHRGYTTDDWQANASYGDARLAAAKQIELSYIPSKPEEIESGLEGDERAQWAISLGRLWIDCGRAVRRWRYEVRCPKSHLESLQSDAMHLILRWPNQGGGYVKLADGTKERTRVFDLGGEMPLKLARTRALRAANAHPSRGRKYGIVRWIAEVERILETGTLPRRADWILSEENPRELSPLAWRALHAAVRQAARKPEYANARRDERELSDEPNDIDSQIERYQRDSGADASVMPEVDAPETLAAMLAIPLDAARAMVVDSYSGAPLKELAAQWGVSEASATNAVSRGRVALRKRFDNETLWHAINLAADKWAISRERNAAATIAGYRHGMADAPTARRAVMDWRASVAGMSDTRRALLAACRRALVRNGGGERWYHSDLAEITARQVTLHMRLVDKHATRRASVGSVGASRAPIGDMATETREYRTRQLRAAFQASESEPNAARRVLTWIDRTERSLTVGERTRADRAWDYGLAAASARETLTTSALAGAEVIGDETRERTLRLAAERRAEREQAARTRETSEQAAYVQRRAREQALRDLPCCEECA